MIARTLLTAALWPACTLLMAAQQAPVRDAAPRPSIGTASIAGTVVGDEPNGRPIRGVVVTLSPAGSGFTMARSTMTDDQGRFAFTRLPAGNYSALRATKAGFVPTTYGQKRTAGMGTPVALAEGQKMTTVIKILRGAVITGTIVDAQGRPAPLVQVQASPIRVVNGERLPATSATFRSAGLTDDRGVYRIYGLAPGDYLVVATPRPPNTEDIHELTAEEVRWAQQQLQLVGISAPGAGSVNSPPTTALTLPPGPAVTYAPLYYNGTTDSASAVPVTVTDGQERTGIDFLVQFVRTAKIQGSVVDPSGQVPQNVQMNVIPKVDAVAMNTSMIFDTMFLNRPQVTGGKFTIAALRPGEYTITARASTSPTGPAPTAPTGPILWASTEISVTGNDLSDLILRLEPGMTITGRVKFEGTVLQPPPDLSRVSLRMIGAPNATGITVSINLSNAPVATDGSFTFSNVTPGRYLISASSPSAVAVPGTTWQVKSAMVGGVDAVDTPFEVKAGQDIGHALLTFVDTTAEISGTLSDATGKPTSEFSVILFSANKAFWIPRSRRLKQPVRAGTDGKFKFTGLAPGDYYMAALTDFEPAGVSDPVFLEQLQASAIKITLADGEKKTQDLTLAGQ